MDTKTVILPLEWEVGCHVGFSGKISDTVWTAINHGMYTLQFFLGNPHSFNRSKITDGDITETLKLLKKFPIKIFSHFPYVANLAGSVSSLAWKDDLNQNNKTLKLLKSLEYELHIISLFESCSGGVVIHPGSFPDRNEGLLTIAKSINKINFSTNSKLILENSAGQGTSLATTLQELKTIIDNVTKKEHIGVCIDTCHLYAYGEYDLSKTEEITRLFLDFDSIIGLKYFSLLHLNDSTQPLKSCKDRHACLTTGCIWKENIDSLITLLNICKKHNIPIVLETHGIDMITLSMLQNSYDLV